MRIESVPAYRDSLESLVRESLHVRSRCGIISIVLWLTVMPLGWLMLREQPDDGWAWVGIVCLTLPTVGATAAALGAQLRIWDCRAKLTRLDKGLL